MKCVEFAEIVHELARSRGLDREQAAIARAHAESCPACGCLLADARRLAAVLREAAAASRRLEAPERVESALLAGLRSANAVVPPQRSGSKPTWLLALGYAGALAMVSLLVFASMPGSPGRQSSSAIASATTGSGAVAVAGREAPGQNPAAGTGNSASPSNTNLASGFVPVPFSGGIARGDAGMIVRVQVPRSALAELGYPADETEGGGVVQADLLIGEDGWPQAVRIVR